MTTLAQTSALLTFVLGGGLAALLGAFVYVFRARADRDDAVGRAAKGVAEASAVLIEPMRKEIVSLHERVALLEAELTTLRGQIAAMTQVAVNEVRDGAKKAAEGVADEAKIAAKEVAEVAKTAAKGVADEAKKAVEEVKNGPS